MTSTANFDINSGMKTFKFAILFLAFSLTNSLSAYSADENMSLRYDLYWSGFKAGQMRIILKEDKNSYDFATLIDSVNLVKSFTSYWSVNRVQGKIRNGIYRPTTYDSKWNRRDEQQILQVNYDSKGYVTKEIADPPKKKSRPAIDPEILKNSIDPITTGVLIRKNVRKYMLAKKPLPATFTLPTYDTKRRFDLEYVIHGYKNIRVEDKVHNLLHVTLQRIPVAGFREKEIKRMKDQEPIIDIYLNDDFIPLWGLGTAGMGTATFKLARFCEGKENCLNDKED